MKRPPTAWVVLLAALFAAIAYSGVSPASAEVATATSLKKHKKHKHKHKSKKAKAQARRRAERARTRAARPVRSVEAEQMTLPRPIFAADRKASGGKAAKLVARGTASATLTGGAADLIDVRARAQRCKGAPKMQVSLAGRRLRTFKVRNRRWHRFVIRRAVPAGSHQVAVTFLNDRRARGCDRNLVLDVVRLRAFAAAASPQQSAAAQGAPASAEQATCPVARPQTTWRPPGSPPLSDAQAAACVTRSGENRPQNAKQNAKAPSAAELDAFRNARDAKGRTPAQYSGNFAHVTGAAASHGLRSTDDIIEWSAYKWGIPEDSVRGQMVQESGWSMLQQGDRSDSAAGATGQYPALARIDGDSVYESLGIAQIRWRHDVPWNPGVEPLRWQSTGFAMDYSQALIRYYYDGQCNWCGGGYRGGDADGAYRTYFSGSWSSGQSYADGVRGHATNKDWLPVPAS